MTALTSLRALAICAPVVFGPAALAGVLDFQPTILRVDFADGGRIEIAATSPEVCATAIRAVRSGRWLRDEGGPQIVTMACVPGSLFLPGSDTIAGFNGPGVRR